MSDLLLVVDGNSLVHRAFHALPPLTTSRGELVNAVFGVAQMLLKAFGELRPRYAVAAFDTAAPTFRHEAYADYKGLRGDTSDNIPGVPGIGDKTASRLLGEYGTVDNLYAHLDALPARLQQQLGPYVEQVRHARHLAQIVTDLPVELRLTDCAV